jgi:hypothetical protein
MGRAKRERIAELERQRIERLAKGEDAPSLFRKPKALRLQIRCGKCGLTFPEEIANAHFAECQPKGLVCGRCQRWIIGPDFVGHMKECLNHPAAEPRVAIVAGHDALKDPALLAEIRKQTRQGVAVLSVEPKEEPKPVDIPENK